MIINAIIKRRSVREFKNEDVKEEDILEIIKAAQFAPTARNNRAVEFVVVKEQKTKDAIFEALVSKQEYVKTAPAIIIPFIETQKSVAPVQDLSLASANVFLQAASLGLGTVWKNIPTEEELVSIRKILAVPDSFKAINIIPIGYPAQDVKPHEDGEFQPEKIHNEKW